MLFRFLQFLKKLSKGNLWGDFGGGGERSTLSSIQRLLYKSENSKKILKLWIYCYDYFFWILPINIAYCIDYSIVGKTQLYDWEIEWR